MEGTDWKQVTTNEPQPEVPDFISFQQSETRMTASILKQDPNT